MYIERTLEKFIIQANNQFPVLMITGARQVGKTTILKHICEDKRTYVSLDDPLVLSLAKNDPALFMQRFNSPLLIDEIQYAPPKKTVRHFKILEKLNMTIGHGGVICLCEQVLPISENASSIPLSVFMQPPCTGGHNKT